MEASGGQTPAVSSPSPSSITITITTTINSTQDDLTKPWKVQVCKSSEAAKGQSWDGARLRTAALPPL